MLDDAPLVSKLPCGAYVATTLWLPAESPGKVNIDEPDVNAWLVALPPSTLNDTFPITVPDDELTDTVTTPLALNVTEGAEMELVVAALLTVILPDVPLVSKLPCGAYVATKLWLPATRPGIVNIVEPLDNVWLIALPPSTERETLPVTVPNVELTEMVTSPSALYVTVGALMEVVVAALLTVILPVVPLVSKLP